MSSPLSIDATILYSGITAAILTTSLIVISQSDKISRFILSPVRLRAKRRQEQLYNIEKGIAKSILYIRKYINDDSFYDWEQERKITDLITSDEEILEFVKEIVVDIGSFTDDDTSTAQDYHDECQKTPMIVGISKDFSLAKADEWYVYLAFPVKLRGARDTHGTEKIYYGRRVQVPLVKFGASLYNEFHKQQQQRNTKTNFCFIADASSSLGSDVLGQVIEHSQCNVPVIHEPVWMYGLAFLIQKRALQLDDMDKVLFGLCNLSAQSVQHLVGSKYNTVALTLPGQACTAVLLPLIQKMFPCERHVFAYDGCFDSVQRALNIFECSNMDPRFETIKKTNMTFPKVYDTHVTSMPRCISAVIPLTPISMKNFPAQTAVLSKSVASITESWISSVDAFLKMKNDEINTKYIPYVCRMGYLVQQDDNPESQSSSRSSVALRNLFEYTLGSEQIDAQVIDAAESILKDLKLHHKTQDQNIKAMLHETRIAIEDCIFLHKSILIGDKVLPDTVQPSLNHKWSLKSSTKIRGCACCFGLDDEDDASTDEREKTVL